MDTTVCTCASLADIELRRSDISARIEQTPALVEPLRRVAGLLRTGDRLYQCRACGQMLQASPAWNWGNEIYVFRVPTIDVNEWLREPFVRPDQLLIYGADLHAFLQQPFLPTEVECRVEGCPRKAVSGVVTCLLHHVESLQRVRMLAKMPLGRWFPPYERSGFEPPL